MHEPDFKIKYRVITNAEDVWEALHLRYITYRQVNFISANKDLIDVDSYDYHSTYLGAYHVNSQSETLIGTMRVISKNEISSTAPLVRKIVASAKCEEFKTLKERPKPFPIMESFLLPDDFANGNYLAGPENKELNNLCEISRLAVRPDYWFRRIDVGLHHLLILDTWLNHPKQTQFMIAIHPRAQKRYERIGMQRIPGTEQVLYKHVDQLAVAMSVDMDSLLKSGPGYRENCEADYEQYKAASSFLRVVKQRMPKTSRVQDLSAIDYINSPALHAKKILIVDDDSSVVGAISTLLRTKLKDYEVEVATNGYEALIKVGEFKPYLLILDIKMSKIDGLEVISRLRANRATSGIKILAMTGHSEAYFENTVLSTGADDYLLKPFDYKTFLNRVQKLLD